MKKNIVILGGGIGGLTVGWALSRKANYNVTVIEKSSGVGGVSGTFEHEGYLLDYGPHKMYSSIKGILDELIDLMGDELIKHEKKNSIYLFNNYLKYPISLIDLAPKMGLKKISQCGFSTLGAVVKGGADKARSYEEYVVKKFGRKLYNLVFKSLACKTWGEPSTLSADIGRTRIPSKNIFDTFCRAVGLRKEDETTSAKYFYYPKKGFGRISQRMAEEIKKHGGQIFLNTIPKNILSNESVISGVEVFSNGIKKKLPCDILISSIHLDDLIYLLSINSDKDLKDASFAAKNLQFRDAFIVFVFLEKEMLTGHHWLFFPESHIIFGRVFEQKKMSEEMCSKGFTVLGCDFTDDEGGELSVKSDEELAELCINDLVKVKLIERNWVRKTLIRRIPKFYPRYDLNYREKISAVYFALKKYDNLVCTGRLGFYNYNNIDHCLDMGNFIAENLEVGTPPRQIFTELEERVINYRIVD